MKKKRTLFFISSLMLLGSGTTIAGDNLHFTGNLISKSCTPVINGSQLAEVHFPAIAASDLTEPWAVRASAIGVSIERLS
ncbi:hypothetical protein VEE68_36030 [Escherichia coli]|nr:hypothetical protein VEE68_36030 [Escherichia coli]